MKGKTKTPVQHMANGSHMAVMAAAAHELKSPLSLINHITHALKDSELDLSAAETAQHLQRLQLASERMLRLVQQLTISYRLDVEQQLAFEFAMEPLSITTVCEDALQELAPYAKEHNQQLRLQKSSCPHLVLANRDVLQNIVVNLVDNALRHNPSGGIVDVTASCRGRQVRMQVHDNGPGMSKAELRHLHRTLGTQPQPLSGRAGNSGLGLYIVHNLARAMGGDLGLSRSTNGTTFFVDLMRSQQLSLAL